MIEENWFKITVAAAILIIALSVGYYFVSIPKQAQIVSNGSQDVCAIQAKKVFDTFKPALGIDTYSYKYHYNSNGTCYVLVHGFGEGGQEDSLKNASENIDIASCDTYAKSPEMNFCRYDGPNEKYDISKFDSFVKPFMND